MNKIIVTRHPSLVAHLINLGLVDKTTPVFTHASVEVVTGKHVFGVLPMHLACHAATITEIPLIIPYMLRGGAELNLSQIEQCAKPPETYKVARL